MIWESTTRKKYLRSHLKHKRQLLAFLLNAPVYHFSRNSIFTCWICNSVESSCSCFWHLTFGIWRFRTFQSLSVSLCHFIGHYVQKMPQRIPYCIRINSNSFSFDSKKSFFFYFYLLTKRVLRFPILSQCFIVECLSDWSSRSHTRLHHF